MRTQVPQTRFPCPDLIPGTGGGVLWPLGLAGSPEPLAPFPLPGVELSLPCSQ